MLPTAATIMPESKIICCVRSPAWIIDSVERLIQGNPLAASRMFPKSEDLGNLYSRYESLVKGGILGTAMKGLRQAWFSEHAHRMVVVRYDSLVSRPAQIVGKLYESLGLEPFEHRFDDVQYEEREYDDRLNTPGLHKVSGKIEARKRTTILPPEIFTQNNIEFWNQEGQNPRSVMVL